MLCATNNESLTAGSKARIQLEAKRLQHKIWKHRGLMWPNTAVSYFDVLSPSAAAYILGAEYQEVDSLGSERFRFRGQNFRTAGLIDRQANKIVVSTGFPSEQVRFTAAHEIGHWILHPAEQMFRDRPISPEQTRQEKDILEKEADYFASCFLIPQPLLSQEMKARFGGREVLRIDDATAFHLNPSDHQQLLLADQNTLERELAVAGCTSFNGNHFSSLAERFGVSRTALALRLKELGMILWP
jgi:Zn-dependent peptidase ImmA (M78 family)